MDLKQVHLTILSSTVFLARETCYKSTKSIDDYQIKTSENESEENEKQTIIEELKTIRISIAWLLIRKKYHATQRA